MPPSPNRMPTWYYDKRDLKNTPSMRDGLDLDQDRRYRKEGARFIMDCGSTMGLGHNTMATGVVYFHRFYVFHSFRSFPRYVTACCCLFLAGKVEETPKKCKDIIKVARSMLSDQKFMSFGDDPKEEVMTLERILLQTIKFDLQVEHPYGFLVKYAKCLKGDQTKLQRIVQMAWNFINDSLSTTVCLQWEPEIIAVALIHLASKLSKFPVTKWEGQQPTHLRWWDMFVADVTMEILEDICHQVLDLYQQPNVAGPDSPPQLPPSKSSPPAAKRAKQSPSSASSAGAISSLPTLTASAANASTAAGGNAIAHLPHHHSHSQQQQHQQQHHQHQQHQQPLLHHPGQAKAATIDEKLHNMAMMRNNSSQNMSGGPMSMSTGGYGGVGGTQGGGYMAASAYGTMFQHGPYGPPLPPSMGPQHQQQHNQQHQQQSSAYASGIGQQQPPPPPPPHSYGPPQQIPTHYQSGIGDNNGSGVSSQPNYHYPQQPQQQQSLPVARGGGGYYQQGQS